MIPEEGPGWGEVGMTRVPDRLCTGALVLGGDGALVPRRLWTKPRGAGDGAWVSGDLSLVLGERPLAELRLGGCWGDGARRLFARPSAKERG